MEMVRTSTANSDFLKLIMLLDEELLKINGDDHLIYSQYNILDEISHVIVAYDGSKHVGCGAMKIYDSMTIEIKRMYTKPALRGNRRQKSGKGHPQLKHFSILLRQVSWMRMEITQIHIRRC